MARARAEIAEWDSRSAVAACGAPTAADTGESDCAIRGAGIGVGPTTRADARGNRESTSAARGVIEIEIVLTIAFELANDLVHRGSAPIAA